MKGNYISEPPDYGDVMTLKEYLNLVEIGMFIDYDGSGEAMKDGKVDSSIYIKPSKPESIPEDATHIIWFNR